MINKRIRYVRQRGDYVAIGCMDRSVHGTNEKFYFHTDQLHPLVSELQKLAWFDIRESVPEFDTVILTCNLAGKLAIHHWLGFGGFDETITHWQPVALPVSYASK